MKYVRDTVTIPEDIHRLLSKERNKSLRVTEALRAYYESKDELGSLNGRLERLEGQVGVIRRSVQEIERLANPYSR